MTKKVQVVIDVGAQTTRVTSLGVIFDRAAEEEMIKTFFFFGHCLISFVM